MDDVGPSSWQNQHNESSKEDFSENDGLDDDMEDENFPTFIPNANDAHSQLANSEGGFMY